MKLNIASPHTGTQLLVDIEDEMKIRHLFDKRIGQEFAGNLIGEDFEGYVFRITGGSDKDGFAMKQGVLLNSRVKLLLARGTLGFQAWRGRRGQRLRKTVRGCIVGPDIAVLCVTIVKRGTKPIVGLTDKDLPRRLGPKRASKLRKLFSCGIKDDLRAVVMRKKIPAREASGDKKARKAKTKRPKIQRLVTPTVLRRRKVKKAQLKARWAKAQEDREHYQKRLQRLKSVAWQRKLQKHKKEKLRLLKSFSDVKKEKAATKVAPKVADKAKAKQKK